MDLAAIRAKVKVYIGNSGYDNTALDTVLNRIYQRSLPLEFVLESLKATYTLTTSEGVGSIAIDPDVYLTLKGPAYLDGNPVTFWSDAVRFQATHGNERERTITAVSTGNSTFAIAGKYDSKFSPPNTFIVIDSTGNDGMWTVSSVSYASEVTTITVVETITDATVDGSIRFQINDEPTDCIFMKNFLEIRPYPDDNYGANYEFKCETISPPTALTSTTQTPVEELWGPILAVSTAMELMVDTGREEEIKGLAGIRAYFANRIAAKQALQYSSKRGKPSF